MSAPINYLTVQDVLWINLQIQKRVETFHYARLEEAVYHQYAYLHAQDVPSQAGRFVAAFLKNQPFTGGNELTALIACETFLRINGSYLDLDGDRAAAWLEQARGNGPEAVASAVKQDPDFHPTLAPEVRPAAVAAMERLLPAPQPA